MVYITKAIEFSATHRLYNPAFSDGQNEAVFGKCNNPHGHGHNYRLEVTIAGEPDAQTGMVMDLTRLKEILQEEIMTRFDHKNLNLDVPEMAEMVPTAENIVRVMWGILKKRLGPKCLYQLRLVETRDNIIEYREDA